MNIPFRKAPAAKSAGEPTFLEQLRDLKARVEIYEKRASELAAMKADIEASGDFRLGEAESALYAQTLGGVELAKAVEKPLRASVDKMLKAAGAEVSRATTRIQNLHRAIDEEIKRVVVASLPADLTVEVVTAEIVVNVTDVFATKATAPSKLHIRQSKIGAAEFAARLDPLGVTMRAYFDPAAPVSQLVSLLVDASKALEKLAAEETRCNEVLARFQQKAA